MDVRLGKCAVCAELRESSSTLSFIDIGIQPTQNAPALSPPSKDEITIHRDLLEASLTQMISRGNFVLTPSQREFLEVVAAAATFSDEILVPKELLNAFLAGNESLLSP